MRPLVWTQIATLAVISAALTSPALAQTPPASGEAISEPVWITRAPTGQYPERFQNGDFRMGVSLRCTVRAGALTECAAAGPTSESFLAQAIEAAGVAQLATQDARGVSTEGREIVVQIQFPIPVAVDPPPAPPMPNILTNVVWLQQPNAMDFVHYYPEDARNQNVSGRATLDCLVGADGRLSCTVTAEDPPGYGFGEATLRVARIFRLAPETRDGVPTAGGRLRRTIRWVIP